MKRYFLKDSVSEDVLKKRGFKIMDTPAGKAGVRKDDIIVILNPPIREIKHRYQHSTQELKDKVNDIIDILEVRNSR
jgi:hypothetical protein